MKLIPALTVLATAAFTGVVAQTQGIPQCVLDCSTQAAATAGCLSFADATCVCSSATFQSAAQVCLVANCTPAEQATALSLQSALCGAITPTGVTSLIPTSILTQVSSIALPSSEAASISSSLASQVSSILSSSLASVTATATATDSATSAAVASSIQSSASRVASSISSRVSSLVSAGTIASQSFGTAASTAGMTTTRAATSATAATSTGAAIGGAQTGGWVAGVLGLGAAVVAAF